MWHHTSLESRIKLPWPAEAHILRFIASVALICVNYATLKVLQGLFLECVLE
jgi:hypothetical protein